MAVIVPTTPAIDLGPDRNKSELTLRVTEAAAAWLAKIGAKAIEAEVPVARSWVADLVAFWSPTITEAVAQKIIPPLGAYPQFADTHPGRRYAEQWHARRQAHRAVPERLTIIHEVKTTRSDFLKDRKFARPVSADIQALSYVRGILRLEEIPANWWALEHHPSGALAAVKRRAPLQYVGCDKRLPLIANIAERRHNRTANQFFSILQKRQKLEDRERIHDHRLVTVLRAVLAFQNGEDATPKACLARHWPGKKFPEWVIEEMGKIKR